MLLDGPRLPKDIQRPLSRAISASRNLGDGQWEEASGRLACASHERKASLVSRLARRIASMLASARRAFTRSLHWTIS